MLNIEKVGEKIAVISNSTRYKRKNKIYLNKEKLTGEDAIKESDLIHIEAGEIMLSPDKDVERTTMYVCGSAGSVGGGREGVMRGEKGVKKGRQKRQFLFPHGEKTSKTCDFFVRILSKKLVFLVN